MLGMSTVRASMALTQLTDAPPITRKAQFDLPDVATVRKKVHAKLPFKLSRRCHAEGCL